MQIVVQCDPVNGSPDNGSILLLFQIKGEVVPIFYWSRNLVCN